MSELKEKVTKGVLWSAIEQFSVQGLQFVFGLIIARIVRPEEYGLIAMIMIFIAIAQTFVDSGFTFALIQKKDRTQVDCSTVFYFNIVISILVYGILFFSAPCISEFYHQAQLVLITRVISLSLIINSLGAIHRTLFTINLNFKVLAMTSFLAAITSGIVGVMLAYRGLGVWALVAVTLTANIVTNTMYWSLSKWRPTFQFSKESFCSLFSFGSKVLFSGLIRTIYNNMYSLVIGQKYNASDVGYFNRSHSLSTIFTIYIVMILEKVSFPVLCSIQDEQERVSVMFNKFIKVACFVVFPICVSLGILASPLIEIVLTSRWMSSVPLLQILCVGFALSPIMMINLSILNVKGRSDIYLKTEIIKKIIAILVLLVTLPFGLNWLCWGIVIYNFVDSMISIYYAKKVIRTSFLIQLKGLSLILLSSIIMGIIMWIMIQFIESLWLKVIIGSLVGLILYIRLAKIFRITEYLIFLDLIKRIKNEKII